MILELILQVKKTITVDNIINKLSKFTYDINKKYKFSNYLLLMSWLEYNIITKILPLPIFHNMVHLDLLVTLE